MSTNLETIQRALLFDAETVILVGGITYKAARTPVGKGLSAYMSLINRRRKSIWSKLVEVPANALDSATDDEKTAALAAQNAANEANDQLIADALTANQEADSTDLIEALFWSIARVDPTVERACLYAGIDGSNQEEIFSILVKLNTAKKVPQDPNLMTPATTQGSETTTAS